MQMTRSNCSLDTRVPITHSPLWSPNQMASSSKRGRSNDTRMLNESSEGTRGDSMLSKRVSSSKGNSGGKREEAGTKPAEWEREGAEVMIVGE